MLTFYFIVIDAAYRKSGLPDIHKIFRGPSTCGKYIFWPVGHRKSTDYGGRSQINKVKINSAPRYLLAINLSLKGRLIINVREKIKPVQKFSNTL